MNEEGTKKKKDEIHFLVEINLRKRTAQVWTVFKAQKCNCPIMFFCVLVEMWMRHDLDLDLDLYVVWRYWTIYSNDVDDQYVRMYVIHSICFSTVASLLYMPYG